MNEKKEGLRAAEKPRVRRGRCVKAINPRYGKATPKDVARALIKAGPRKSGASRQQG